MEKKNYDQQLSRLRIFACILVILVHITNSYLYAKNSLFAENFIPSLLLNVIARIGVPLFFMITGILSLSKPYSKEKNKKKFFHFILIVILWSIFYLFWNTFILNEEPLHLISYIFEPVKNHLWYMYDLIGFYLAFPFIHAMVRNMNRSMENYFLILWLILGGGARLLTRILGMYEIEANLQYYVPIVQATYHLGYFICGYILYKRKDEFKNISSILLIVISIALTALTSYLTFKDSSLQSKFHDTFLTYGSLLTMLNSISIFLLNLKYRAKYHKALNYFSGLTFGIYLFHPVIIDIFKRLFSFPNTSILWIPIMLIGALIISTVFTIIVKQIPFLKKCVS